MKLKEDKDGLLKTLALPSGGLLYGMSEGIGTVWYTTRREALESLLDWSTFVRDGYKRSAPGKTYAMEHIAWVTAQLKEAP